MSSKLLKKVGATVQDMLLGIGTAVQSRGDNQYTVDKLGIIPILGSVERLKELPIDCKWAAIAKTNDTRDYVDYYHYDATSTATANDVSVIQANQGNGRWLRDAPFQLHHELRTINSQWLVSVETHLQKIGRMVIGSLRITTNENTSGDDITIAGLIPAELAPDTILSVWANLAENDASNYYIHTTIASTGTISVLRNTGNNTTDVFYAPLIWYTAT